MKPTSVPWPKKKLADLVPGDRPIVYGILQAGDHVPDGVPYLKTTDVTNRTPTSELQKTSREIANRYRRAALKVGDVVFCLRGAIGESMIAGPSHAGTNLTQGTARISPGEGVQGKVIVEALQLPELKRELHRVSKGSALKEISLGDLRRLVFPCPPPSAQIALDELARHFDGCDEILRTRVRFLRHRKMGLMRDLLTGRRQFPEFEGEWAARRLGDLLTESRERAASTDPNRRISVRLHCKGCSHRPPAGENGNTATIYYTRKAGQLIYGKQNIHRGAVARVPSEFDGYETSQDVPAFDIAADVNPDWLLHHFLRPGFHRRLGAYMSGTGSKRLYPSELLKQTVDVPPRPEQDKIAAALSALDLQIALHERLRDAAELQKRGLMDRLLSGELPLPDALVDRLNAEHDAARPDGGQP